MVTGILGGVVEAKLVETNMSGSQPSHESKVGFAEFRGAEPSLKVKGDGDPGKGLGLALKYHWFSKGNPSISGKSRLVKY